jgi:Na+-driven multidrug efflux pump
MMKSIGRLSAGSMVEQVGLRFGFFAYARVVADLGTIDFASHFVAMQLMVLSFTFADGIGAATTALVGQNLGAKRPDLSTLYGKIGLRMAFICAALLSTACILMRFRFPMLFAGGNQEIINTSAWLILILAAILPLQTTQLVMGGSLRGAGDTRFVAITMILTVGIMRPLFGFLLTWPLGLGLTGAWLAIIADQAARLIMLFTRFHRGKWKEAKL